MNSDNTTFDLSTLEFYDGNAESYLSARPDEVSPTSWHFCKSNTRLPYPRARLWKRPRCRRDARAGIRCRCDRWLSGYGGARQRAACQPARVLRFDELDAVEGYDAIVACASLLHVPHAALPAVLARIWRALKPGGWHFAGYKTAGSQGWDVHKRYYNQLTRQDADQLYCQAGAWASISFDEYDGAGHFSAPSRWLTATGRKAPERS